jgi:hypothetical protein
VRGLKEDDEEASVSGAGEGMPAGDRRMRDLTIFG